MRKYFSHRSFMSKKKTNSKTSLFSRVSSALYLIRSIFVTLYKSRNTISFVIQSRQSNKQRNQWISGLLDQYISNWIQEPIQSLQTSPQTLTSNRSIHKRSNCLCYTQLQALYSCLNRPDYKTI